MLGNCTSLTLILFALRYHSSLENNLKSSPVNLELKLKTGYKLDESFFKDLENNPKIDFVLPLTRSLSTTVDIAFNGKIKEICLLFLLKRRSSFKSFKT